MRRVEASLALALLLSIALLESACALTGQAKPAMVAAAPAPPKPIPAAKPAPPPEPLSVAQTQVQLPPPQPVSPDAEAFPPKLEEPATAPAAPRPPRRTAPSQPKPDTPAATPAVPTVSAPAEPDLAPIQEMLPADEKKRYLESATSRKAEIHQLLIQIQTRHLSGDQSRQVKRIQSFVAQSDEVEKHGDMRQADALAERGLILARELANGK